MLWKITVFLSKNREFGDNSTILVCLLYASIRGLLPKMKRKNNLSDVVYRLSEFSFRFKNECFTEIKNLIKDLEDKL